MKNKYIIFDLDDTLAYEIDYLKSAYKEIAQFIDSSNWKQLYHKMISWYRHGENVFEYLNKLYRVDISELLKIYRHHFPQITLINGAKEVLTNIKNSEYKLGLITDGRSITQRNKLKALGIEMLFDKIIISEEFGTTKPHENNYEVFVSNDIQEYFYVADNPKKDFITPNKLGWTSICLLNSGNNIHDQNFDLNENYLPKFTIRNIIDVLKLI